MKKSLIALAAFAAVASAQADVTVYGILDPSIIVQKMPTYAVSGMGIAGGTSTTYGTSSAQDNSSQLGFKGTESLGSGMKAIFDLQGDLTLGNGFMGNGNSANNAIPSASTAYGANSAVGSGDMSAPVFNRNAYVGLETSAGTVKIGRQFTPFHENQVNNDAFSMNSGGYLAALSQVTVTGAGNFGINRASQISAFGNQNTGQNGYGAYANGISFELPAGNGLVLKAFQTFGNMTGLQTANAAQSLGIQSSGITSVKAVWDVNPTLKLNAAYQVTRAGQAPVPTAASVCTSASNDANLNSAAALYCSAVGAGAAGTLSAVTPGQQVFSVSQIGAQYTAGSMRFTAGQFRLNQQLAGFDGALVTTGGVLYALNPTTDVGLEFTAIKDTSVTTNTANTTAASYRYKLGKTASIWALYGTTTNAGNANMNSSYSGIGSTLAAPGTVTTLSSGIRYTF